MIVATEPTLREAADAYREPFLWLPEKIRKLCTKTIERSLAREYKKFGKPFLLSQRGLAGVYPSEAHWLVFKEADRAWIDKHLAPLIAITGLIPQIAYPEGNVFFHSGDLGDIVASLPTIRQLGGGRIVIGHVPRVGNREAMRGPRFDAIRPLLEIQPYVTGVVYDDDPDHITHNLSSFRHDQIRGESLADWQARHLGVSDLDLSPWLSAPDIKQHGSVVFSRSLRYHNIFFPWAALANRFEGKIVFVGLPNEHKAMERLVGRSLPYQETRDLLDLARVIAGGSLFVGNQSAPFWIAVGLGIPIIQESWESDPNSVVPRSNCVYTTTGADTRTLLYRLKAWTPSDKQPCAVGALAQ